ncbi:NAD(P)-dependent oxidoreductase [Trichococcus shcherbakoviae]|uniref:D-2-hydroxyacid dehydrogenase n=1 Tax=Trichococcus shcherbakoviae subsp. psychrophilus TaxID=2585775 RepID=A0A5C5EB17_9LACT|nr:NAD(P)-dependent oxidoreductase [Trichococcus shcherbakoviae]TNV69731.1 D-2-hydroxyacid dehydrogenase [Trichococcus shcherbakoviae subsp. psychrophilus]
MRLIYYGVSADEEKFIKRWSFSNKIPVTIINEGISSENVHFAGPHDGVCLYPSPEMRQSELLYRKLREQGIHQLSVKSTGVDGINFEWAEKYGLTVTNVPSYSPTSVGHFAIMSILMVLRNIPTVLQTNSSRKTTIGRELQDVTVGILGTGRIGCVVAEGIHALGGRVIASSSRENPRLKGKVSYVSFEELLEESDVLSIHIPLSEKSTHLFSEEAFEKMKPGSCLVNTARGKIVDTEALIEALATGKLAGAALDALEDEEKYFSVGWENNPYYSRLMAFPNVMITPHIAYHTELAVQEIVETSLTNARDIITAGISRNTISL